MSYIKRSANQPRVFTKSVHSPILAKTAKPKHSALNPSMRGVSTAASIKTPTIDKLQTDRSCSSKTGFIGNSVNANSSVARAQQPN